MKILVAGSKRGFTDDTLCRAFDKIAHDVGGAIARSGHTLLIESDDPITFDYHAVEGAIAQSTAAQVEVHRLFEHARAYGTTPDKTFPHVHYRTPPFQIEEADQRLWARVGAVSAADAVIIMGGRTGTATFGSAACDLRVPLVAVREFGGEAAEVFDRSLHCYQSRNEVQNLLNAVRSPTAVTDPGDCIVRFTELWARKNAYFLSYAHEDDAIADHAELVLRREDRIVFRDEARLRLGQIFEAEIRSELARSDTYVGLWSRHFSESDWCRRELDWALELNQNRLRPRRVCLVLVDETPLPEELRRILHAHGAERSARFAAFHRILREEI